MPDAERAKAMINSENRLDIQQEGDLWRKGQRRRGHAVNMAEFRGANKMGGRGIGQRGKQLGLLLFQILKRRQSRFQLGDDIFDVFQRSGNEGGRSFGDVFGRGVARVKFESGDPLADAAVGAGSWVHGGRHHGGTELEVWGGGGEFHRFLKGWLWVLTGKQ